MSDVDGLQKKLPKLIVVMAFDLDNDGQLETVFGPQDFQTEGSRDTNGSITGDHLSRRYCLEPGSQY